MKKLIVMVFALFAALFATAQSSSASVTVHPTGTLTLINSSCHVGTGQSVSGKHLWECAQLYGVETQSGIADIEGVGKVYCYLNGSNSSQVACGSFSGRNYVNVNDTLTSGPLVSCGAGSGKGACPANGIIESFYVPPTYSCSGVDESNAHYGDTYLNVSNESAVDGQAAIGGTIYQVGQWWGNSVEVCFG
jgi:type 1 fimbria pilin